MIWHFDFSLLKWWMTLIFQILKQPWVSEIKPHLVIVCYSFLYATRFNLLTFHWEFLHVWLWEILVYIFVVNVFSLIFLWSSSWFSAPNYFLFYFHPFPLPISSHWLVLCICKSVSVLLYSFLSSFWIPHISDNIKYLCFSDLFHQA